jgi:multidrug efflux system membrane fusion protein
MLRLSHATLILLLATSCAASRAAAQPAPRPVRVQTVVLTPEEHTLTLSGSIQARTQAELAFRVGGKVIARPVEVGDVVHAGQELARLDPQDLQLQVQAAASAVEAAGADAAQAKAELGRYQALGTRSPAYLPSEHDRRLAASRMADARLAQAARQYALANDQATYGALTADADGIVTALPVQVGQVVAAGQTVATVAHAAGIEVSMDVPENRLDDIRAAQLVAVTLWSAPGRILHGHVREIGALADPASRTFNVKVAVLDAPPGLLALGMTATVRLAAPPGPAVALLPATALTDEDGHPAVWVLDPAQGDAPRHAEQRLVTVAGYREDGQVAVGGGLRADEQVVTAGAAVLDPALPVIAWGGPSR